MEGGTRADWAKVVNAGADGTLAITEETSITNVRADGSTYQTPGKKVLWQARIQGLAFLKQRALTEAGVTNLIDGIGARAGR